MVTRYRNVVQRDPSPGQEEPVRSIRIAVIRILTEKLLLFNISDSFICFGIMKSQKMSLSRLSF
jgi:hypothetical protein